MRIQFCLFLLLGFTAVPNVVRADEADKPKEHPLKPAIRYAESCLKKVEALPGYGVFFLYHSTFF